jgi:hypothetical protein
LAVSSLPARAPTKFVINLKTAGSLGLSVPANLLALSDRVIERARSLPKWAQGAGLLVRLARFIVPLQFAQRLEKAMIGGGNDHAPR